MVLTAQERCQVRHDQLFGLAAQDVINPVRDHTRTGFTPVVILKGCGQPLPRFLPASAAVLGHGQHQSGDHTMMIIDMRGRFLQQRDRLFGPPATVLGKSRAPAGRTTRRETNAVVVKKSVAWLGRK
jgi:hypothetical protein